MIFITVLWFLSVGAGFLAKPTKANHFSKINRGGAKMRILIAQSNLNNTAKIKSLLIAGGFDIDIAIEGEEALTYAAKGKYAVIILDIFLEKKNGFDVCKGIRDSDSKTPILMLTDKPMPDDEVYSLEFGANDFLRIPFSPPVLMARIKVLLRINFQERSGNIMFGSFFFDQKSKKCFFDKQEISFTSREGKIFEILMLAEGNVVTKQALIDQVWGLDFNGDPNIVHVYIGYLRRKLHASHDQEVLQTVRGIGYRLVREKTIDRRVAEHFSIAAPSHETGCYS